MARRDRLKANEIALLRFEPVFTTSSALLQHGDSSCSSNIRCLTEVVSIEAAPAYVALSYVWGDASITKPIYINGFQEKVTSNLESALSYIQSRVGKTEALWVDAVCINQQDDVEKSEQVAHMRDVYANAARVIVWLGPAEDSQDVDLALDWMMSFGARAASLNITLIASLLSKSRRTLPNEDDTSEAKDLKQRRLVFADELKRSLSPHDNPEYKSLMDSLRGLLSRPYWERLWIVQEFALAKTHDFVCGSRALDFHAMMCGVRILDRFKMWQVNSSMPASVRREDALRRYSQAIPLPLSGCAYILFTAVSQRADLLYLLRMYRQSRAKDPRDHIFAFLGIASDSKSLGLVPDYRKPRIQIYTELARALLENGQFDVLGFCNARGEHTQDLQSWVPDWSGSVPRFSMVSRVLHSGSNTSVMETSFRASGSLQQPELSILGSHAWCRPLVLSVIIVCSVAAVGNPWRHGGIGEWLHSLATLTGVSTPLSQAGRTASDVIWQTAAGDQGLLTMGARKRNRIQAEILSRLNAAFSNTSLEDIDGESLVAIGLSNYRQAVLKAARGRRGFMASTKRLACGADNIEVGDLVVIVLGAQVPFIVRKRSDGDGYTMLGEAYVHGYMDGEAVGPDAVVEQIILY